MLYCGFDTKTFLNSKQNARKTSKLEFIVNRQLPWNLVIIFAIAIAVTIAASLKNTWFLERIDSTKLFYSNPDNFTSASVAAITFITMFIAIQGIIPIPFYVTWDLVKLGQVYFINQDVELHDKKKNEQGKCNTLNITEDLGQIEYIFSDKTGTLTENVMLFKRCVINGKNFHKNPMKYSKVNRSKYRSGMSKSYVKSIGGTGTLQSQSHIRQKSSVNPNMQINVDITPEKKIEEDFESYKEFFMCILLCHSALVSKSENNDEQNPEYESESADELALLHLAHAYGCTMTHRNNNEIIVKIKGTQEKFKILHFVKFEARRKKMSIVVQNVNSQKISMYLKGADEVVLELARQSQVDKTVDSLRATKSSIDEFAIQGLRTLCMAKRDLAKEEYTDWFESFYSEARDRVDNSGYDEAYDELEREHLELLGGTGIEDKLQDKVPATIKSIRDAGLKIWVITGDKMETAINIAYSSKLLTPEDNKKSAVGTKIYKIDNQMDLYSILRIIDNHEFESNDSAALVITGNQMQKILDSKHKVTFLNFATELESVIVCRATERVGNY